MNTREKSNSVTHLVKIVAKEIFDEEIGVLGVEDRLKALEGKGFVGSASAMFSNIVSSLENAGDPWDRKEDELLLKEVNLAVSVIAKNHRRSEGAIRSRMKYLKGER